MGRIRHDAEYEEMKKQYAELLAKLNPKGTEEEIEEIKKRVEARRWGKTKIEMGVRLIGGKLESVSLLTTENKE